MHRRERTTNKLRHLNELVHADALMRDDDRQDPKAAKECIETSQKCVSKKIEEYTLSCGEYTLSESECFSHADRSRCTVLYAGVNC